MATSGSLPIENEWLNLAWDTECDLSSQIQHQAERHNQVPTGNEKLPCKPEDRARRGLLIMRCTSEPSEGFRGRASGSLLSVEGTVRD